MDALSRSLKIKNRMIALIVSIVMLACLLPTNLQLVHAAQTKLQGPRATTGGVVTWDCVYFGRYPQSSDGKGGFNNDPIKWRVLSVNGQDVFLLADKNLDGGIPYNEINADVTWETCTLRSWLNGYGRNMNNRGEDYTADNFADRAFTSSEQNAIRQTTVVNEDNPEYDTEGGSNTQDKVYLLSIGEARNPEYGFPAHNGESEAREAVNTAYTASKSYMNGEGSRDWWWLRSPGDGAGSASGVNDYGYIYCSDTFVGNNDTGVRPALHLNLSSNLWSYAGTVSSDGQIIDAKPVQTITAANVTKPYGAKPFNLNAKTSGDGKLTYKSSNPAVATVSSTGVVTIKGAGKVVITISAAETDRYSATTKNVTITVTKVGQSITGASSFTKTYGDKTFSLGAKTSGTSKLTYKSSDSKVATVSSAGKVTLKGSGKATITITAAASSNYNAATKRVAITVKPKKLAAPKVKSTKSRTLKVSWKRDTKATGYQAVIAQNEKFTKGKKTATITKNKTTSKTFKKLKRKKTYYAKVRAYKKVGSTKLYGSYSKVKKVRVR